MRPYVHSSIDKFLSVCILVMILFILPIPAIALNNMPTIKSGESENFIEYKGKIVDKKTGNALAYASLMVDGLNISTISNSEGEFSLKISKEISDPKVTVSFIGYKNKSVLLADLESNKFRIEMEPSSVQLPELNVISKDAELLMRSVLEKKGVNYFNTPTFMTAF